jgi:hypothetical protein
MHAGAVIQVSGRVSLCDTKSRCKGKHEHYQYGFHREQVCSRRLRLDATEPFWSSSPRSSVRRHADAQIMPHRRNRSSQLPVPARVTACGDPVALSAIESDAFNAPAAAGLNSTETVQEAAAASVVPQVVADLMNEVALVPVMVSDVRFNVAVPEFLMVTT